MMYGVVPELPVVEQLATRTCVWVEGGRVGGDAPENGPLYDTAKLIGVEEKVESMSCGAHLEGTSRGTAKVELLGEGW